MQPDAAPAARDLERVVVGWLTPAFGMHGGHLVPGSTVANLTALWAAREIAGIREVVASEAAHLSVRKTAHLLGLGFREVPVDDQQRLRPDRLGDLDHAAVVLTQGRSRPARSTRSTRPATRRGATSTPHGPDRCG